MIFTNGLDWSRISCGKAALIDLIPFDILWIIWCLLLDGSDTVPKWWILVWYMSEIQLFEWYSMLDWGWSSSGWIFDANASNIHCGLKPSSSDWMVNITLVQEQNLMHMQMVFTIGLGWLSSDWMVNIALLILQYIYLCIVLLSDWYLIQMWAILTTGSKWWSSDKMGCCSGLRVILASTASFIHCWIQVIKLLSSDEYCSDLRIPFETDATYINCFDPTVDMMDCGCTVGFACMWSFIFS